MKALTSLILLSGIAFSSAAFAENYYCGYLKHKDSNTSPAGAPSLTVLTGPKGVVLNVSHAGAARRPIRTKMTLKSSTAGLAVYRAGDYEVAIKRLPTDGKSVTISRIANQDWSAVCRIPR